MRIAATIAIVGTLCTLAQGQNSTNPIESAAQSLAARVTSIRLDIRSKREGVDLSPYMKGLVRQINSKWQALVPGVAISRENPTEVGIDFEILPDGEATNINIVSSTGQAAQERAALDAIHASAPFPRVPSGFQQPVLALTVIFLYGKPKEPSGQQSVTPLPPTYGSYEVKNPATVPNLNGPQMPASLEVLSNTQGVDFGPYLSRVVAKVKAEWNLLIPADAKPPEVKRGKVSIEFSILPDGQVGGMKIVGRSGDAAMDRAAWGAVTGSGPFAPLPKEYRAPNLSLRLHFYYNPPPNPPTKTPQ